MSRRPPPTYCWTGFTEVCEADSRSAAKFIRGPCPTIDIVHVQEIASAILTEILLLAHAHSTLTQQTRYGYGHALAANCLVIGPTVGSHLVIARRLLINSAQTFHHTSRWNLCCTCEIIYGEMSLICVIHC